VLGTLDSDARTGPIGQEVFGVVEAIEGHDSFLVDNRRVFG
jgi:hypothetical protein